MLDEKEIEELKKEIECEFPNDFALQQIHFSRKILSKQAEKDGIKIY